VFNAFSYSRSDLRGVPGTNRAHRRRCPSCLGAQVNKTITTEGVPGTHTPLRSNCVFNRRQPRIALKSRWCEGHQIGCCRKGRHGGKRAFSSGLGSRPP
jgi:hypothetical protein